MDLKAKLARLTSAGPRGIRERAPDLEATFDHEARPSIGATEGEEALSTEEQERRERIGRLRSMLGQMIADDRRRVHARRPAAKEEPIELPGECLETPQGKLHRVAHWLEPHHRHGRVPVAGAPSVSAITLSKLALDPSLEGLDPSRLLYVDTETTGLAGGTGTIPFLIGMAWFEDESLRLEQLLLRCPGEETPMLTRLAERMALSSGIVSYNGKSFDWPLLRNRFVLNRVPVRPPEAHLDLLHCARRVFKRRLGHVRLVHMEEEVLGLHREHDIDGAEIPQRYWDFVREANGSLLAPIIEHNANDLVALAAIMVTLVERYERVRPGDEPADQLGVAEVAAKNLDPDHAELHARAAASGGGPLDVTVDALWLTAELARHREDHSSRVSLLRRQLEVTDDDLRAARAHLALAKIYEHKTSELEAALGHARCTTLVEGHEGSLKRVARIERKILRAARQATLRTG